MHTHHRHPVLLGVLDVALQVTAPLCHKVHVFIGVVVVQGGACGLGIKIEARATSECWQGSEISVSLLFDGVVMVQGNAWGV
jgi:hypothetical protein